MAVIIPDPLWANKPVGIIPGRSTDPLWWREDRHARQEPMTKAKHTIGSTITQNKKARHDFAIEERLEGGLVLQGWEVKSLRAGRVQLRDSYVLLKGGEAWLFGALISPLPSASTHVEPDPARSRKVLLHRPEINRLIGAVERKGYTAVATALYWKKGRAKVELGLAKGKKAHDKRTAVKEREWGREQQRVLKHAV
jgi:SsrA-binding protein